MAFRLGIDALRSGRGLSWIEGARVGLVSHPAAVASDGRHGADLIASARGARLTALFAPEHGFFGESAAGCRVAGGRHPRLRIPVFSLYGAQRRPTPAMLKLADVIVFDVQDLGARMYTFVSTLRLLMEAVAAAGKRLVVADRPIPLPCTVDGPVLDPAFESFVGMIPAPAVYGMTPGETALWLRDRLGLDIDLRIAPMTGYRRAPAKPAGMPWYPPSPQIRAWETGWTYPCLVFLEAFQAIDHARGTPFAFQAFAHPRVPSGRLIGALEKMPVYGARFVSHQYVSAHGAFEGRLLDGVRLHVHDPNVFKPALCACAILAALGEADRSLWRARSCRAGFLDLLFGSDRPRKALMAGTAPRAIRESWRNESGRFLAERRAVLLYPPEQRP